MSITFHIKTNSYSMWLEKLIYFHLKILPLRFNLYLSILLPFLFCSFAISASLCLLLNKAQLKKKNWEKKNNFLSEVSFVAETFLTQVGGDKAARFEYVQLLLTKVWHFFGLFPNKKVITWLAKESLLLPFRN